MCPYCNSKVDFSETPRLGQQVTCPKCGERLEVSSLNPLTLVYEYSDDYSYADNYNDDYIYDDDDRSSDSW